MVGWFKNSFVQKLLTGGTNFWVCVVSRTAVLKLILLLLYKDLIIMIMLCVIVGLNNM